MRYDEIQRRHHSHSSRVAKNDIRKRKNFCSRLLNSDKLHSLWQDFTFPPKRRRDLRCLEWCQGERWDSRAELRAVCVGGESNVNIINRANIDIWCLKLPHGEFVWFSMLIKYYWILAKKKSFTFFRFLPSTSSFSELISRKKFSISTCRWVHADTLLHKQNGGLENSFFSKFFILRLHLINN